MSRYNPKFKISTVLFPEKAPCDSVEKATKSDSCRRSIPSNVCPCCGQITSRHIYSKKSPRKYPAEVGKLCKKVFEDD